MGKELLRNGGFERGDLQFWEMTDGIMEIATDQKKTGTYSVKITTDITNHAYLYNKDFIKVDALSIYFLSVWIRKHDPSSFHVYIEFSDAAFEDFKWIEIKGTEVTDTWINFKGHAATPEGSVYAQIWIMNSGFGVGDYSHIDAVSFQEIDVDKAAASPKELITVLNETTKHTVLGSEFFTGIWKEAEYFYDLTSFTETLGANPVTIDVKIESYDPETDTWRDAMVFQQKSCPASGSVTTQEYKRLVGGLGWKQRVSYTTAGAGTIGDCDFKVGVVYKR